MKLVPAEGIVGQDALREAASTELTQIMGLVRAALQARFDTARKPGESYVYFAIEALFPDRVVVDKDGRYWQFGYTLNDKNEVVLAEPLEVIEEFKPVALREAGEEKGEAGIRTGGTARSLIGRLMDAGMTLVDISDALDKQGEGASRSPGTLASIRDGKIANPPDSLISALRKIKPPKKEEMKESHAGESAFLEAADSDGRTWDAILVRAGESQNRNVYPASVLREAAPMFEGARVYAKSNDEHLRGAGKDVNKLAGWISEARFVEGALPDAGYVAGRFNFAAGMSALRETIADAWKRGKRDLVGLSVDLVAKTARAGARRIAKQITKVHSVDLIVEPSAGGALVRMTEAVDPKEQDPMKQRMLETIKAKKPELFAKINAETITDEELEQRYAEAIAPAPAAPADDPNRPLTVGEARMIEARQYAHGALSASKLPELARQRLQARFDALARFDKKQVDDEVKAEREYLARMTESGRVQMPGLEIEVEDKSLKIAGMLDAFFDPKHKEHRSAQSFRECYIEITGDRKVTGRWDQVDRSRLAEAVGEAYRESLDSTSWANVLGNAITRRAVADYRTPNVYGAWRPVVNVVPVNDFRTNERTRWGGYGDLPVVAQGDPYVAFASPTDEKATYAVAKRGGTEDVTLEMIKNDDVGAIRQIPTKLSRSAQRTLGKFVFDFVRTNPVIYDGLAFFHATHGNLGAAALDATSLAARRLAMLKQTELNSAERLGIGPKYLVAPSDLQEAAVNLFNRNTNLDKTFVQMMSLEIIPVWYWTDVNDWALAADPLDIPGIEVGFLDGQEEPEFFVQDQPTQGSMFSNDKVTYKIRHIYGGNVVDFRGWDKSVV